MAEIEEIQLNLYKLMKNVIDENKLEHRWLLRCIKDTPIEKRNDHYFAVIGKITKDKQLSRVEIKFTPYQRKKFEVLIRKNKSTIKSRTPKDPSRVHSKNPQDFITKSYETINDKEINIIEDLLHKVFINDEVCHSFENFYASVNVVNTFKL